MERIEGLPKKLIEHRSKPFDQRWEEAMDWWKSQTETLQQYIRSTAEASLVRDLRGTGQGISSSDINHRVYDMYHSYLYYPEGTDVLLYLVDYSNE